MSVAPFRHRISRWLTAAVSLALLALAACSHAKPARPDVPASALQAFRRGVDAYREEDYEHAARLFELAASKDDRNATIQYNLGLAYYMLEAYPESIEAYQKCLKLDPKFADAHMNLALAYDRTYDLDQANAHYNAYLALVRAQTVNGDGAPAATTAGDGAPPQRLGEPRTAQRGAGHAAGERGPGVPGAAKSNRKPALVLGGEPLSSLPGGNLARYKGEPQAAAGSPTRQIFADGRRSVDAAQGGQAERPREAQRSSVERLREAQRDAAERARQSQAASSARLREAQIAPSGAGQAPPSSSSEPTFSSAEPWWTQETPPQNP